MNSNERAGALRGRGSRGRGRGRGQSRGSMLQHTRPRARSASRSSDRSSQQSIDVEQPPKRKRGRPPKMRHGSESQSIRSGESGSTYQRRKRIQELVKVTKQDERVNPFSVAQPTRYERS